MPSTVTSHINMFIKGVPPSLLTKSLSMGLYSASTTGMRGKIDVSLPYNAPMGGTTQQFINLALRGPYIDVLSAVIPLTISGASYRFNSNQINITIFSDFISVLSECFVEETSSPPSIELEDLTDCLGILGRVPNGFDMFMKCDGTGTVISEPLNLTIRYNPANIIMMTMRASGTQNTNTMTVFMKASNLQTSIVNITIPIVHAVVTRQITFSTRGF